MGIDKENSDDNKGVIIDSNEQSEDLTESLKDEDNCDDAVSAPHYAGFMPRLRAKMVDVLLTLPLMWYFMASAWEEKNSMPPEIERLSSDLQRGLITVDEFYSGFFEHIVASGGVSSFFFNSTVDYVVIGVVILIFWFYKSATPGKMLLSLKIVDAQTLEKPSRKQFVIRYLGYIPSTLCLGLGYFWILFDKKKQSWHDKMASTLVIKTKIASPEDKEKKFRRQTMMFVPLLIIVVVYLFIKYVI